MIHKKMKKDSIIQFVGFATQLEYTEFLPRWEDYASQLTKTPNVRLLQCETRNRNGLKFISQHEFREGSFRFNFMKGRSSEHFPEQQVRVAHLGGYAAIQLQSHRQETKGLTKILVTVSHTERDIDFYQRLSNYTFLDIYEAYYESCVYGYLLEYLCTAADVALLLEQLRSSTHNESAVYKDCKISKAKTASNWT